MGISARERARERFSSRCGYCGVHEDGVGATLTIDHHRPRSHGGTEESENIVYACPRCNEHKGAYWHDADPPHIRLLDPGRDDLTLHLRGSADGRLAGVTPEGAFFIEKLRLNRAPLIAHRVRAQVSAARAAELDEVREQVRALEQRIADLRGAVESTGDAIQRRSSPKRL
ncbi:MAG: HNH endonuclease [Byssovorax sp.]